MDDKCKTLIGNFKKISYVWPKKRLALTKSTINKIFIHMNIKEIDKPEIKKTVVVYAGRFQPFHKGHYATYQKLILIMPISLFYLRLNQNYWKWSNI